MTSTFLQPFQSQFKDAVEWLRHEYQSIRTGRANPALIDELVVEVYGVRGPLKQYASISVADARTMTVQPWDSQTLKDIERALSQSDRGFTTAPEGTHIRVILPEMTEENRKNMIKILHGKLEQAKLQIRGHRDKIRETIQKQEKAKEITQDDRYQFQKELDELTNVTQEQLMSLTAQKEKEIMTV